MRLIDADALSEYLDKRRTYEVMDGRNKAYGKGVRDATKDIENAPTIDAIPVEWLREWQDEVGTINEWWPIIERIIEVWQQEQEAQE